jgi:transcription termination/antitermination protein NusG
MTAVYQIGDYVDTIDLAADAPTEVPIPECWYFVRVHPLMERKASDVLQRRGVSCYAPTFEHQVKVYRRWTQWTLPKTKRVRSPLFPGIIFVPDSDADVPRLKAISQDVVGLLKFGEFPARLSAALFRSVRELEKTMGVPLSKRKQEWKQGDELRVKWDANNPFATWRGRFDRLDGKGRLRVLLQAASREVPVILAEDQVEPV